MLTEPLFWGRTGVTVLKRITATGFLAILMTVFGVQIWTYPSQAGSGMASYYGGNDGLCGGKTASGKRFDCHDLTAAHRTLPFGTKLSVTHKQRTVVVRITDRGPFIKGRVLDLSLGAARALAMTGVGVGHVKFDIVD